MKDTTNNLLLEALELAEGLLLPPSSITRSLEMLRVWWEIKGSVACGSGSSHNSWMSYTSRVRFTLVFAEPVIVLVNVNIVKQNKTTKVDV